MALRLAVLKSVFSSYNKSAFPLIIFFVVAIYLLVKNMTTTVRFSSASTERAISASSV